MSNSPEQSDAMRADERTKAAARSIARAVEFRDPETPAGYIVGQSINAPTIIQREWGFEQIGTARFRAPNGSLFLLVTSGERLVGVARGSRVLLAPFWSSMLGARLVDHMLRAGQLIEDYPSAFKSPAKSPAGDSAIGREA